MRHRQIRKQMAADIRRLLKNLKLLPLTPRNYQIETFQSMLKWLEKSNGTRRAHISHATGLGKTFEFSTLVSACKDLTCLIVVPNRLLVQQTVRAIVESVGGTVGHVSSVGKIKDEDGEVIATRGHNGHRIVVTTDISYKLYAEKFAKEFKPHVIIRDECHWSYTEKSSDAMGFFPEAVIIGYSATPDYLTTTAKEHYIPVTLDNGQTLYAPPDRIASAHFGTLLDRRSLRWGIEHEYLAPLAWGTIEFDFSLDDVPVTEGPAGTDYDEVALQKLLAANWHLMEDIICRLYKENQYTLRNRQVFAMCPGVAQAESLARRLSEFVKTACITGGTPDDERDEILKSFDKDKLGKNDVRFIASVFVLREGWNARNAEVCMMLRPTRSRVLYEQFMGRGLRLRRDGKSKVALVLDAHFQGTTFSPLSAPVLYGIPGQHISEGGILIGPRRRRGGRVISPYMIKRAKPKLHVVKVAEVEYWAGSSGFFYADDEWWGTREGLVTRLKLSSTAINNRLGSCRFREGKSINGVMRTCYALKDVEKACKDLLEKVPQAGPDGFFKADGELWGTKDALARRLCISTSAIAGRLSSCRSRKGKNSAGSILKFYALKDIESASRNLLEKTPIANPEGFFKADGELWGTKEALVRLLDISPAALELRIGSSRTKPGKDSKRRVRTFYSLKDVEKACKDLLEKVPQAGPDGFFKADGELWGMQSALSRRLKLSENTVRARFKSCRSRKGRDLKGGVGTFYSLKDVEKACKDLLEKVPQAGPDGFFKADGELWGSSNALSKRLKISRKAVIDRLPLCRAKKGKTANGVVQEFYSLKDVEKACKDLLEKVPQAGPDGFFKADGEPWGTQEAIAKRFRISPTTASTRLKSCRARKGKKLNGIVGMFFALKDAKKACASVKRYTRKNKKRP